MFSIAWDILFNFGLLWLSVVYLFPSMAWAARRYKEGTLSKFWQCHYIPGAIAFIFLDAAFNYTWGRILFGEFSKETLFSGRIQNYVDEGNEIVKAFGLGQMSDDELDCYVRAVRWGHRINEVDPMHIKRLPPLSSISIGL